MVAPVIGIRTFHGKQVCAEEGGAIVGNRDAIGAWETFTVKYMHNQIALYSAHGKWMCASPEGIVVADRDAVGAWETFNVVPHGGGYGIQSAHGKFLCAEADGRIVANRDAIGDWETFYPVTVGGEPVVLGLPIGVPVKVRTVHGKFFCAEGDGVNVVANRDAAGGWETFHIEGGDNGTISFRSWHNTMVCALPEGHLEGNRTDRGAWEEWKVQRIGEGFAFQNAHGNWLCGEADGRLVANRPAPGDWETFFVEPM